MTLSRLDWNSPHRELADLVTDFHATCLEVYRHDQNRIEEDAQKEASIAEGGYGRKQIQELIQNAADALRGHGGRIEVRLTEEALYVANQGTPFERSGVRALLYAHLSNKTGDEIGRFGLGFKSVSGISDSPQVYSQTVSFGFHRAESRNEIESELGYNLPQEEVPALRLAWGIDIAAAFDADPILNSLSKWAVTIVKVPLKTGVIGQLEAELDEFDESFCLFTPHVRELRLVSEASGLNRTFKAKKTGKRVTLTDSEGSESHWLVVSTEHTPSERALESAGKAASRTEVVVSWAVPLDGRAGVGQLSAYFPVKSEITLSGRLNAPWKLSDDRINVIEGAFNEEILEEVVPQLVVQARPYLIEEANFGRYIDILPARGRESRSWADRIINEPIYAALRQSRCLPNGAGELRSPNSLWMIPENIPGHLEQEWLKKSPQLDNWVHPDCTSSNERRSKTERLMANNDGRIEGHVSMWLESVIQRELNDPAHSSTAICFAGELLADMGISEIANEIESSKIVLLETGMWVEPVTGRCFIRTNPEDKGAGFIDQRVTDDVETRKALILLGIREYAETGQLFSILQHLRRSVRVDWEEVWTTFRASSIDLIQEGFDDILEGKQKKVVRIKNGRGEWVLPDGHYIPGEIVHKIDQDSKFLVNERFHSTDHEILKMLGIRDRPYRWMTHGNAQWLKSYRKAHEEHVGTELGLARREWGNINMGENTMLFGPLDNFTSMSEKNRATITRFILQNSTRPYVDATHPSTGKKSVRIIHPEYWLMKEHGLLPTNLGLVAIGHVFVIENDLEDVGDIVPMITGLDLPRDSQKYLGFRSSVAELSAQDFAELVAFHVHQDSEHAVGKTYAWWCNFFPASAPDKIHVQTHEGWHFLQPSEIAVTVDDDLEQSMEELGIPTLSVPEQGDSYLLSANWGLMEAHDVPIEYEYDSTAEPELVTFRFPPLMNYEIEDIDRLHVQPCASLEMTTAIPGRPRTRREVPFGREDVTIYTIGVTEREQLTHVLRALELDANNHVVEKILDQLERKRNDKLRTKLRASESDAERLLLVAGEDRLLSLIPGAAVDFMKETTADIPTGVDLAEICIKMYGTGALEHACSQAGDELPVGAPPKTWRASYAARQWVKDLGFPEEWAGRKEVERNKPTDFVDGPTFPGEFHDYQLKVSERLRKMLKGEGAKRGLITLPTGAGKTRVTVQTIIEAIRDGDLDPSENEHFSGPILWLVDGEELCEQAIDAWAFLWRAFGRPDTRLVLSRHWGQRYNATEETTGVQVVVATWQKVVRDVGNPAYEWLRETPLIVIDEAHTALSPSYTKILEWTGRTRSKRDKLLLGLSATPFRGRADSAETERLHNRFDRNFLDEGVFGEEQPLARLQNDRILSHVTMEIIRNDDYMALTPKEIIDFKEKHWLPKAREQELGQNIARTQRIIDSIKSKPNDWSILVFAASVNNAETLATLLTLEGIPATSISQNTSPAERKLAIERFKNGDLRVITNYAVLSQGFDAPKTRAVYITRPTTSEVRYQQMIGRGLRGPKNGGTDDVHIVNLLDNIQEFDLSINYTPFAYLADDIQDTDE